MEKSLEAGLKRFPEKIVGTEKTLFGDQSVDANLGKRILFMEGYRQAEKDITMKIKAWLSEIHRVYDITDENGYKIELRDLKTSFEKTLKE